VSIEIADTGIGIDEPQLSTIFEAFEQGDSDIQARFGGLGLGLAICQGIIEAHHGSIVAASPGKGRGATFTVTLPLPAINQFRDGANSGQILSEPALSETGAGAV